MGKNILLKKMKAFALACLLGTIVAESPDCPESTQVFSYTEHVPAAAGFLQTTACHSAGVAGVNCLPNNQLFASGMNGDEDLAEGITMKGDKFHYIQKKSAFATGMNGDEDLAEDITMKGDKFHYVQRPAQQRLFATGMNGDEDLAEDITMKGDKFHYVQRPAQHTLFATGMNGDEDLGEDITMKG